MSLAAHEPRVEHPPVAALSVRGVGLTIDGTRILDDVSLEARRGEFLAVIGPNGAGKTSLINVLSGAVSSTTGTVALDGRDITRTAPQRRMRMGMGRTFQTSTLFLGCSVFENVRLALNSASTARLRNLAWVRDLQTSRDAVMEALELVDLHGKYAVNASALSHGDRRKLELAVVIAQGARTVLLDEPMAGVNAADVEGLVSLIRDLQRNDTITIVMVEHHLHVVLDLADRIAVLHHGKLLAIGEPDQIMADSEVQTAYVGQPL